MVNEKISLDDLYFKVGVLFFTLLFLFLGLYLYYIIPLFNKNLMLFSFIFSYFGAVYLSGTFLEYFIDKSITTSKSFISKIIIKLKEIYNKNKNISNSILGIIVLLPLGFLIYKYFGKMGLFQAFIIPTAGYVLKLIYDSIQKYYEEKK